MVRAKSLIECFKIESLISLRALGTSDNTRAANLDYPLAFQNSFIKVLEPRTGKAPFRYIHLSGKFVEQDQDRSLWLLEVPRKTKACILMPTASSI
jgi:hypothetical protein